MNQIKSILSRYIPQGPHFGDQPQQVAGGGDASPVISPSQTQQLRAELEKVSEKNKIYFLICFGLLVLLFVAAFILVISSLNDPDRIKVILGVTGVSFFGLVTKMTNLWKQKVSSDLMLVLAANLGSESLQSVIEVLLRGMQE